MPHLLVAHMEGCDRSYAGGRGKKLQCCEEKFCSAAFRSGSCHPCRTSLGSSTRRVGTGSQDPLVRSALTCSQTPTIVIAMPRVEREKLKVQLVTLLRESLYDDAKGIVNIARGKTDKETCK